MPPVHTLAIRSRGVSLLQSTSMDIGQVRDQVSIAILTVRPDECDAVLKCFPSASAVTGGKNWYWYARVEAANGEVGVAVARCIEQGEGIAQATARNVIDDLNPKWLLLVGIGGGKPDDEVQPRGRSSCHPVARFRCFEISDVHRLSRPRRRLRSTPPERIHKPKSRNQQLAASAILPSFGWRCLIFRP